MNFLLDPKTLYLALSFLSATAFPETKVSTQPIQHHSSQTADAFADKEAAYTLSAIVHSAEQGKLPSAPFQIGVTKLGELQTNTEYDVDLRRGVSYLSRSQEYFLTFEQGSPVDSEKALDVNEQLKLIRYTPTSPIKISKQEMEKQWGKGIYRVYSIGYQNEKDQDVLLPNKSLVYDDGKYRLHFLFTQDERSLEAIYLYLPDLAVPYINHHGEVYQEIQTGKCYVNSAGKEPLDLRNFVFPK